MGNDTIQLSLEGNWRRSKASRSRSAAWPGGDGRVEGGRVRWEVVEWTLRLLEVDWSELSCRSWGNFLWEQG